MGGAPRNNTLNAWYIIGQSPKFLSNINQANLSFHNDFPAMLSVSYIMYLLG